MGAKDILRAVNNKLEVMRMHRSLEIFIRNRAQRHSVHPLLSARRQYALREAQTRVIPALAPQLNAGPTSIDFTAE
jgi:hypothetical protein